MNIYSLKCDIEWILEGIWLFKWWIPYVITELYIFFEVLKAVLR